MILRFQFRTGDVGLDSIGVKSTIVDMLLSAVVEEREEEFTAINSPTVGGVLSLGGSLTLNSRDRPSHLPSSLSQNGNIFRNVIQLVWHSKPTRLV